MKVHANKKKGISINVGLFVKKIRWLKFDYMWNPSTYDSECNKDCKIDEYLDIKNCSCEKCLSRKLTLACKNKILNTAETSLKW